MPRSSVSTAARSWLQNNFCEPGTGRGEGRCEAHDGLRGMPERATALGGELEVRSEGAGTEVELSVPAGRSR
jgi:nitrate/nitrite-specific signal transduction histidine kinase